MTADSDRFLLRWAGWSVGRKALLLCVAGAIVAAVGYLFWAGLRTTQFYSYLKASERGWTDGVFTADAELGFAPVRGSAGQELLPIAAPVPACFDAEGFRIPAPGRSEPASRPALLALGCSWTYGAACRAEDTFTQRAASALGLRPLNAGVPSYGLAQMLLLARRLVPRERPAYVLVQYSDWLVQRSQSWVADTEYGYVPTPFFAARPEGVRVHPPLFRGWVFDLPISAYRRSPMGALDYVSFLARAGLPLIVHDDFQMAVLLARRRLGGLPAPGSSQDVLKATYSEIADLCRRSGARMLVVLLGPEPPPEWRRWLEALPGATVVDAAAALCAGLPEGCANAMPLADEAYVQAYAHWAGSPPQRIDLHPNPRAHAIIAEEIVRVIIEQGGATSRPPETPRVRVGSESRRERSPLPVSIALRRAATRVVRQAEATRFRTGWRSRRGGGASTAS